jgi:glucokinase
VNAFVGVVGDIGGTNTRLGAVRAGNPLPEQVWAVQNADFPTFSAALSAYLSMIGTARVPSVCLAIAGPVTDARVELTNHDWAIDSREITSNVGADSIRLLNDLQALALSLDNPSAKKPRKLAGSAAPSDAAPRLVIGVGTGFNAALLLPAAGDGPGQVLAAECGHMTLAIEDAVELRLRDHLARGRGRASVERALSGRGLEEIYEWLAAEAGAPGKTLSGQAISALARQGGDQLCRSAAEILLRLLARTAGDLALAYLPMGGIYFAGSVARALEPLMRDVGFDELFVQKGRQTDLLRSVPLFLIEDDKAALFGCATHQRQSGDTQRQNQS